MPSFYPPADPDEPGAPGATAAPPPRLDEISKEPTVTRALRSHQLWLTLTYFGLLVLMARGFAV